MRLANELGTQRRSSRTIASRSPRLIRRVNGAHLVSLPTMRAAQLVAWMDRLVVAGIVLRLHPVSFVQGADSEGQYFSNLS